MKNLFSVGITDNVMKNKKMSTDGLHNWLVLDDLCAPKTRKTWWALIYNTTQNNIQFFPISWEVVLCSWDKWIHHFQNGFFGKKWSLLIMNCPIVCRQFFNQVNFLAGVYIYLKNFFFFFLQTDEYLFKASSKYK